MIMETLRISLKLYSTFHTDLLVLKECDAAFTSIVKLALYYRVRGRKLNIYIPECRAYRYRYQRAFTKEVITIDDEVTILFLTTMIREKRRMAFVRSVLYDALICPPCGEYFKDSRLISLESKRLGSIDLSGYNDIIICRPGSGPKKYRPKILRPTINIPEWVPREWFSDPLLPENDGKTSHPAAVEAEGHSASGKETAAKLEHPGRKRKKKEKRKKVQGSASSVPQLDGDGTCQDSSPVSDDAAGNAGTSKPGSPPHGSASGGESFPMLEEEEF